MTRRDMAQVGCLHGSHSSGRDVRDVLEEVRPGAVVLELCESRHKALRQDLEKKAKVCASTTAYARFSIQRQL